MFYISAIICLLSTIPTVLSSEQWPPWEEKACTSDNKQKAMYGSMKFDPTVKAAPFTKMRVRVKLDDFRQTPNLPATARGGGVYIAYTIPGGYLGVQANFKREGGGKLIFSIWDGNRWIKEGPKGEKGEGKKPRASDRMVWPMASTCKRNCQDCMAGVKEWSKKGFTTGTQCVVGRKIRIGDEFEIVLEQTETSKTINTKDFQGMPKGHIKLINEMDRDITGSVWSVSVNHKMADTNTEELVQVGKILFEATRGFQDGFTRLGTFDEMLGCVACSRIQHKDTRYGPFISGRDGIERSPVKISGNNKGAISECKYKITGSASDSSISFEGGPLTVDPVAQPKGTTIWEKNDDDMDIIDELVDLGLATAEDLLTI